MMHLLLRLIYSLVHLFTFHISHQVELRDSSAAAAVFGDRCLVHFGVQSDIPSAILESFLSLVRLDRQSLLDRDGILRGYCAEFVQCPAWRTIDQHPPQWMIQIGRHLRCGKTKDEVLLHCCPEIKAIQNPSTIVFPDEITEEVTVSCNQHPNRRLLPGLDRSDCLAAGTLSSKMGRILGGKSARLGQYPWMVRLAYKPDDRGSLSKSQEDLDNDDAFPKVDFRCGGVLLNDRYVLTAAHCLRDPNHRVFMVRLGELDERSDPDCEQSLLGRTNNRRLVRCADGILDIPVVEFIVHQRFNQPQHQNDIGLLRLNASVKLTEWIRPICLPFELPSLSQIRTSLDPVLVGWGRDDSFEFAETLQGARLAWFNTTACTQIYANAHPRSISISESLQFCLTGSSGRKNRIRDSCHGDSGGPVVVTDPSDGAGYERVYSIGIVSFGPRMCGNGFPSVNTWIPAYLSWILDNIVA